MKVRRGPRRTGDKLSARALALIRAARPADEPSQADYDRVHAALVVAVSLARVERGGARSRDCEGSPPCASPPGAFARDGSGDVHRGSRKLLRVKEPPRTAERVPSR
jgi:hypothetical protein